MSKARALDLGAFLLMALGGVGTFSIVDATGQILAL